MNPFGEGWSPRVPPLAVCIWMGPGMALLVGALGQLSGWLKLERGVRTGDTRKIFHFGIFTLAAALGLALGVEGVNLLGGVVAAYIVLVLLKGEGSMAYEGLAREQDRPRRSLYIILPFISTALGGIISSSLFGGFAVVGYAVAGWGDAIAEPIGVRYGKHRYRVPNLGAGVASYRSVEGSLAVFAGSWAAAALTLILLRSESPSGVLPLLLASAGVAAAAAAVEAVSHHGLDNLTVQVVASGVAYAMAAGGGAPAV